MNALGRTRNKLATVEAAAASISHGDSLSFSGFGHSGHPMTFVRELIRQGTAGFTLNAIAECWPAEFLVGSGAVVRLNMSNLMFEGLGRCRAISRAIETGSVVVDDHSHLALSMRLLASGWGVPFLPIRSMAGTDLERIQMGVTPKYARLDSPFGDGEIGAISALKTDVAIIHVNSCDENGNGIVDGAISVVDAQIRGASRVIVTTERLVTASEIVARNQTVTVPGILVDTVVHTPFGSHPGGMYGEYDEDLQHAGVYYEASRAEDTLAKYHADYIHGLSTEEQYRAAFGSKHLLSLRVDPTLKFALQEETA